MDQMILTSPGMSPNLTVWSDLVIMYIRDKKGKKDEHPPDNTHERVEPAEAAHTVKSREPELNPEPNKPDPVVAKIEAKMHIPDPIELKGF